MKERLNRQLSLSVAFLLLLFFGCAIFGGKKLTESTDATADTPTPVEDLKALPQPVGGLHAVIAALRYPEEALKKNWEGVVMVAVLVDAAGRVNETRIAKSSGYAVLDDEALITVARVRWEAGRKNGKPVTTWTTVPVEFRVD